jgi:hypothetical protein
MKRSPKQIKEEKRDLISPEIDKYPWGLRISLCEEEIKKLSMPEVTLGKTMTIVCKVEVVSSSMRETTEGTERDMSLQITDMEVQAEEKKTVANRLYSKG